MTDKTVTDLECGAGGWAIGFIDAGFKKENITGYDILDFSSLYPANFIQTDVFTYTDFPYTDIVVASPECTEFSKTTFPKTWKAVANNPPDPEEAMKLVLRDIEIIEQIKPEYWVIENVRGAIPFFEPYLGNPVTHVGSRYLWGEFPDFLLWRVGDAYGKDKISPSPDRHAVRSIIPYSISRGMAEVMRE